MNVQEQSTDINQIKIRYPRACVQIRDMVVAQIGLNKQAYSSTWMANGARPSDHEEIWDYPLAAAQEIGEFLNSWGYSWWSKAPVDRQNCMTELVDAWHFLVSQAVIEEDGDADRATDALLTGFALTADAGEVPGHRHTIQLAKRLMKMLLEYDTGGTFVLTDLYSQFFSVLASCEFSLDHFTARYNAKLQLNLFRQLNGYNTKPRTYKKLWADGKEDNFYLATWIDKAFESKEAKMPTDAEVMHWIAVNYAAKIGVKAVVPSDVDQTGKEE